MFKKIFKLSIVLVAALITVSVCAAGAPKMPPTVVQVAKAQQKAWQETIVEAGSLSAFNGVMLSSEVSGRITHIYFESGRYVKKGTLLLQIFPDIVKAELDKSKAALGEAKLEYQRGLKLYKKGYLTKAEIDKLKFQFDGATADVKSGQATLNEHTIRAPFSGNVGLRKISIGDYIQPGEDIVSLQSIDPMRVDFSVPQKYLSGLKLGDKMTITSKAFAKTYSGKVYALDSIVDPNTRSINVRAKVPNPNRILMPGSFVKVTLEIRHPEPVVVIPATALVYSASSNYVYLAKQGRAARVNVTIGNLLPNNQVIVLKGLKAGDPVIVAGQMKLFPNAPVIVAPGK